MEDFFAISLNLLFISIAVSYAYSVLGKTPEAKHKNIIILSLIIFKLLFIIHLYINDNIVRKTLFFSSILASLISITFYFKRYLSKANKNYLDLFKLLFYSTLLPSVFFKFNHFPYSDILILICMISAIPILAVNFKKLLTQG